MRPLPVLLAAASLAACAGGGRPVAIDTKNDACASCRMPISDARLAAQLLAPNEEPLLFDDIGCLRDHLAGKAAHAGAQAWVADHRTGAWAPVSSAVIARCPAVATPMGSHLLAWVDDASRQADPASSGGVPVAGADLFQGALPRASR